MIYALKPDFQMSLRTGIAKRVRSIAEIKQDIGHSWNKVYKDKLSSPLSIDSMSAQMLGVRTGISVSLFGWSLCKNHPIVKGVEDMLSVCRQGFRCLENSIVLRTPWTDVCANCFLYEQ